MRPRGMRFRCCGQRSWEAAPSAPGAWASAATARWGHDETHPAVRYGVLAVAAPCPGLPNEPVLRRTPRLRGPVRVGRSHRDRLHADGIARRLVRRADARA